MSATLLGPLILLGLAACIDQESPTVPPNETKTSIPVTALSTVMPAPQDQLTIVYDVEPGTTLAWRQQGGVRRVDVVSEADGYQIGGRFSVEGQFAAESLRGQDAHSCVWSTIVDDRQRAFVSCNESGAIGGPFDAVMNAYAAMSGSVRVGDRVLDEDTICYEFSTNLIVQGGLCVGVDSQLPLQIVTSSAQRGALNQTLTARCAIAAHTGLIAMDTLPTRFEGVVDVDALGIPSLHCS
jgi:hypothetical protein